MSFIRKISSEGNDGTTKDFYYLVESLYEDEKVRQKVIKYLRISPDRRDIPIDPSLAGQVASTLVSGKLKPAEMKDAVEKIGLSFSSGKPKSVSLRFSPPRKTHPGLRLKLWTNPCVSFLNKHLA